MKYLTCGILLAVVILSVLQASAITRVVGASGGCDTTAIGCIPRPSGICTGTLTMTDGGTIATGIDLNNMVAFKAGQDENLYAGVGYLYGNNGKFGGTVNTRVIPISLSSIPPVVTGNAITSTNGVPDATNASNGYIYDPARAQTGGFIQFGTKADAPCTGGAVNCLHLRSYKNATTQLDIAYTGVVTASGFYEAYLASDRSTWVAYIDKAGGSSVVKLNSSFSVIGTIPNTMQQYYGFADDGVYVYALATTGGSYFIRRMPIGGLTTTDFNVFGTNVSNVIAHVNGFLYVGQSGLIRRVRTSDMTITGTLNLTAGDGVLQYGMFYDVPNDRLYATASQGTSITMYRINLTSFTVEQTFSRGLGSSSGPYAVGYEFQNKRAWVAAAESNALVMKTNLCS